MKIRNKILLLFLLTCIGLQAQNLPYADYKRFHFGFSLGLNFLDFNTTPSQKEIDGETYQADVVSLMPGFTVSLISDVRLNDYFNVRFSPGLHFGERTISYLGLTSQERFNTSVQSAIIALPVYLKFSAFRVHDYKPYLIAGGGVSFDVFKNKKVPIMLNTFDYFIDFGAGCCIYFPYFRFSPEIKFSIGFNNVLMPFDKQGREDNIEFKRYNDAIAKMTTTMLTVCFNFE